MKFIELLKNKFVLIMSLPQNDPKLVEAAIEGGADVLKVHINVEHRASKTLFRSLNEEYNNLREILAISGDRPCGIVLGGNIDYPVQELTQAYEMGFDFISLYAHHTKPEVLNNKNISKMIAVDYTYDSQDVKVLEILGIDAIEASIMHPEEYGSLLSVKDIIKYKIIRESTSLPIIVPSQKYIMPSYVKILKDIGINGIMIGAVVTGKTSDAIYRKVMEFRKSIDSMYE